MESEIEIIQTKKRNYKRLIFFVFVLFLLGLVTFFGWRAYGFTKKIIVSNSSNASPYLLDGDLNKIDISKFESGDRRINILLLGMGGNNHPGGNLTDTIQVVSIDPKNKEVAILSIPRDFYVKVKGLGSYKINQVFSLDEDGSYNNKPDSGENQIQHITLVKNTISDVLGVPIHYAVILNFDGFKQIIDILGGIDIDVKKDLYDPFFPDKYVKGYDPFYITSGQQHMDGETALKYSRSRETTSDFDRSARQQEVMMAVKDKALKTINISKINQILNVLSNNLKTDLQLSEIDELLKIAKDINSSNIKTKVLDDSEDSYLYADNYDGAYVLVPKDPSFHELQVFISQYFKDPLLVKENARISILNGSKNEYIANSICKELISFGYNVVLNQNTEKKTYTKTFIYDYSNGAKSATLDFLKKYLNNIPVITLDEKDQNSDIEIIIGDDYKQISIK